MRTLGIDIDGVLNDHRRQFSRVLQAVAGKRLDENSISVIPVHKMPYSDVTEADEHAVLNWPRDWAEMPAINEPVGSIVHRLAAEHGARVCVFTNRNWPNPRTIPLDREREYWNEWVKYSPWANLGMLQHVPLVRHAMDLLGCSERLNRHLITRVTNDWLRRHRIHYHSLVIERQSSHRHGPGAAMDRYAYASKQRFWVFVEDNPMNACRLAANCEIVFLMDHPYNREGQAALPSNVVRVDSWNQILEALSGVRLVVGSA